MSEQLDWREPPAPNVYDVKTGELIAFQGKTVPYAAYRELEATLAELNDEYDATRKALGTAHRAFSRLAKEYDDVLGRAADANEVETFLRWWRTYTQRGPKTLVTTAALERTRAYRRLRRNYTTRDVALMVVGAYSQAWRRAKGLTDIADLEKRADDLLAEGRRLRGEL